MGFNKRFLSEEILRRYYNQGGVENVLLLFKADAIITEDKFSSKITDVVGEFSRNRDKSKLDQELKQAFDLC
jgi:hypothetical protein